MGSCREKENSVPYFKIAEEQRKEIMKASQELKKFESIIEKLHAESVKNPEDVLLKADSLILKNNKNQDTLYNIKSNIATELFYLKGCVYYRLGKHEESIKMLDRDKFKEGPIALGLMANYIKMHQFEKAGKLVDHLGTGIRSEFAKGNYYECISNKQQALAHYELVVNFGKHEGYDYYDLALARCKELKKTKPTLLSELYFPDGKIAYPN
jgi:tetratricopeptide (TPR) repeat protein